MALMRYRSVSSAPHVAFFPALSFSAPASRHLFSAPPIVPATRNHRQKSLFLLRPHRRETHLLESEVVGRIGIEGGFPQHERCLDGESHASDLYRHLLSEGSPMKNDGINDKLVSPDSVINMIRPGMSIFIGSGMAEPSTLVKTLLLRSSGNLQDLELIQIVGFGNGVACGHPNSSKFRLKTFLSGWDAHDRLIEGNIDLVPCRAMWIPRMIECGQVPVNAAFIQITPPDSSGNCSLGVSVDAARQAMDKAELVVGEINSRIPRTFGDTFVHVSDFRYLVRSTDPPIGFTRGEIGESYSQVADNLSELIGDGSCIAFFDGPLFESLARKLIRKRHLGIHSPLFSDAVMAMVEAGAVTNRFKGIYRGKSLTSYAAGTPDLLAWLHQNPHVEFQSVEKVFNPDQIARNPRFVAVVPARKIDLQGRIALHGNRQYLFNGPVEIGDFVSGAELSPEGRTIAALPSRTENENPNVQISVEGFPHQFRDWESVDMAVTEYGVARLKGYTIRERAQALIDIAHPDDRPMLIEQAKAARMIYQDQIFLADSARLYPSDISDTVRFKDRVDVHFRPIRPSDEEQMRRLFYRFSDDAVYDRYFGHVRAMPHDKMQTYVNVDWRFTMSIVGLVKIERQWRLIAECRYIKEGPRPSAEVVFVVDEAYQGLGIATYMYKMLIRLAKERGLHGFTADVRFSNQPMMKVFRNGELAIQADLKNGIYHLWIPFYRDHERNEHMNAGRSFENRSPAPRPHHRAAGSTTADGSCQVGEKFRPPGQPL